MKHRHDMVEIPSMFGSFTAVAGDRVEMSRLSKATLVDLSHVLEDLFLIEDLPGVVMTGFQSSRNWTSEADRYGQMAQNPLRSVAIFTNESSRHTAETLAFTLAENSSLRQEWFVIALTESFSCALFGLDNPDPDHLPMTEMDRLFDAAWTFDPEVITDLCELVHAEAASIDPARAAVMERAVLQHPPRKAAVALERRFHRLTFEALECRTTAWRAQMFRERELNARMRSAESRSRRLENLAAVGTTASMLAHEINNPLAAIGMAADLITAELQANENNIGNAAATPDRVLGHAAMISGTAADVGRIVRGILDFVRPEDIAVTSLELGAWITKVADELTVAVGRPVRATHRSPVMVRVDADRLRHAITNLVRNATQADASGEPIEIDVLDAVNDQVVVHVTDHGPGVPEDLLWVMFQPFMTSRASSGGTGLGLPLARKFMEDIDAGLDLVSTGPSGTTFAITLRVGEVVGDVAPAQTPTTLPSETHHALVVDDHDVVREMLAAMIRRNGWTASTASTPDEAAKKLAAENFDVLLVDYRLSPTVTFSEVRAQLEIVRPGVSRRMLVVTASLASELNDNDLPRVLHKPFPPYELAEAMLEIVARTASESPTTARDQIKFR